MGKQKEKQKDRDSADNNRDSARAQDNNPQDGAEDEKIKGKSGIEHDATGGRRAKHNDDEDKYVGRGGNNSGKGG